jgi:hypothetical protein
MLLVKSKSEGALSRHGTLQRACREGKGKKENVHEFHASDDIRLARRVQRALHFMV